MYNFADSTVATATAATNVFTLSTVGTAASTDKLQIIYDCATGDPTYDVQPVSATSLPLPTGASTAAKQPALGTAGSASADVLTVQGITSMTPLKVDNSGVTQPVSGTVTATLSSTTNAGATAKTTDYDTGAGTDTVTMVGIALPASGGAVAGGTATNPVQVSLANTAANATAVKVDGSAVTQPVSGTVTAVGDVASAGTDSGNPVKVGAIYESTLPTYTNGQRGNLHIDSKGQLKTAFSFVDTTLNPTRAADNVDATAVTTNGTFLGVIGRNTVYNGTSWDRQYGDATNGTWVNIKSSVALSAAQSGTWTVQPGNTANTTPWLTTNTPATAGGYLVATGSIGATATAVKASAGQVFGWYIYNANASVVYVQFFNVASGSVTLGTTVPVYSIGIPATSGANVEFMNGIAHSTAIAVAVTTTRTGSTGPSSTVDYNIFYK